MASNTAKNNKEKNSNDLSNLPDSAIIRLPDVLRLYPISKSAWWQGVKEKRLPAPIPLGVRARGWRLGDILALTKNTENE